MLCSYKTAQDVNKYYGQTYVVIPEYDPLRVLVLQKVDSYGIHFKDPTTGELGGLSFKDQDEYHLDFHLPHKQYFQHGEYAYLLERIPAKMWRKGVSSENTKMYILGHSGVLSPTSWDHNHLNAYLKGVKSKVSDVHLKSVALTDRIAYCPNKGILLADTQVIGQKDTKEDYLVVLAPFKNHVKNLLESYKVLYV